MRQLIALTLIMALALAGCGGGSGGSAPMAGNSAPSQSQSQSGGTAEGTAEENLQYQKLYLEPVIVSGVLRSNFGPGELDGLAGTPLMFAFEDLTGREQMMEYWQMWDGNFPRETVESCLTAYFEVTPEELRTKLLADYYRPEEEVYFYEGGRGGGPIEVRAEASRKTGNTLELDFTVLIDGMDGPDEMVPFYTGTLTVTVEGEGAWKYTANRYAEVERQEQPGGKALAAQGVVSGDGLSYRNDALGLGVDLGGFGRKVFFVAEDITPVKEPGMRLDLCYEANPDTSMAVVTAMTRGDYEADKASEMPGWGESIGENSGWVFTVGYSRANPYDGSPAKEDYRQLSVKLSQELLSCIAIQEPTA